MTDLSAVEALFSASLALTDSEQRAEFLDRACEDPTLRAAVERLLAAHAGLGDFLEPTVEVLGNPTADYSPGSVLAGRYTLVEEVGEGGMGSVWAAQQTAPILRTVAVKLVKAGMDGTQVLARFDAERQALALMDHPNIARVLDGGAAPDGRPFFVMELVQGLPITEYCDQQRLSPRERLELFIPVCQAIQHAHQKGVIHRDIKPTNVLVAVYDERPSPKVIDFGVAKATGRTLTDATLTTGFGAMVGTPEYMSPEQATLDNLDVDTRSDVYALGVLLYELLAGGPPISREDNATGGILEFLRAIREDVPPRPSRRLSTSADLPTLAVARGAEPRALKSLVRGELDWIVMKALEKDRSRRYETPGGLADDVRRYLDGDPVLAAPPSAAYRVGKFLKRHRVTALAACLVVMALGAGVVGTTWGLLRAEAERARAVRAAEEESRAHREAARGRAELAMDHGRDLAEQGEMGQGLLWLADSLHLAEEAEDAALGRAARVNLAEWAERLGRPLARLRSPSPAKELAFLPNGRALMVLGEDGALRCWDADSWLETSPQADESGRPLIGPFLFDPSGDGVFLAFDGAGRGASWDAGGRRRDEPTFSLPAGVSVRGAAFVEGGRRIVACESGGGLLWWDAATGQLVDGPDCLDRGRVYAVAAGSDESAFVTGGEDGEVVYRSVRDGRPLGPSLPHGSPVRRVSFLGDGRRIVVLTDDGHVRTWDGAAKVRALPPEGAAITTLAVGPGGDRFATGAEEGAVRLWDSATVRQVGPTFKLDGRVGSLAFRPDGLALAVGLQDGSVLVWEVPRSGAISPPRSIQAPVRAVVFSRDGEEILAAGGGWPERWCIDKRSAKLRTARQALPGGSYRGPDNRGEPTGVAALSPDGRLLATATAEGPEGARILLLDSETGEPTGQRHVGSGTPAGLAFSPDSRRLLTWGVEPRTMALQQVEPAGTARPVASSLDVAILDAAFSPDGAWVLLGCRDGQARIWDLERDHEILTSRRPFHAYPITAVAFDPHGRRAVTGCHAGTVRIWDIGSGAMLRDVRGNAGEVTAVAFSPDGKTILTGSLDATARFWDAASGRQLGPPLRHGESVLCVAFHPNGRSIAVGTRDGTVHRWRAPAAPMEGKPDEIDRLIAHRLHGFAQRPGGFILRHR